MLRRARVDAPGVRPGTHGGTPYEICARYAVGEIDRTVALRELTEWLYARLAEPNPFAWANDGALMVEDYFNRQFGRAPRDGFLTDEDYDVLLDALTDDQSSPTYGVITPLFVPCPSQLSSVPSGGGRSAWVSEL